MFCLQTLLAAGTRMDLRKAIDTVAAVQPIAVSEECKTAVFDFVTKRLEQLMIDRGINVQVARAILNERSRDLVLALTSAQALQVCLVNLPMLSISVLLFRHP